MSRFSWDYGDPENSRYDAQQRRSFVKAELDRLVEPDKSDPPAVAERKRREAAERLRRHDEIFDVTPGCTIPAIYKTTPPPEKLPEAAFEVGDMEAQRDGGD